MIFVDTNVLLDILQDDSRWVPWSERRFLEARVAGDVVINVIVIAELSRDYRNVEALRDAMARFEVRVEAIDDTAGFLAGQRFVTARERRAIPGSAGPLPDFFIGAHAVTLGAALLTRDVAIYRRYFPELTLITPETHPHG